IGYRIGDEPVWLADRIGVRRRAGAVPGGAGRVGSGLSRLRDVLAAGGDLGAVGGRAGPPPRSPGSPGRQRDRPVGRRSLWRGFSTPARDSVASCDLESL